MERGFKEVENVFKKNDGDVILPVRSTKNSAGYDFVTPIRIVIYPRGTSQLIFTDVKAYMNDDEVLMCHVRSSLGMKKGISLANTTGVIDADYYQNPQNDGNIGFRLRNNSDETVYIDKGERVIQGVFQKYLITDDDEITTCRDGGIGSTGK